MSRWIAALALATILPLAAQDKPELKRRDGKGPTPKQEAIPAEEDKSLATHEYAFNPVQAQKEIRTGNYYFKKGSYRAAGTAEGTGGIESWLRLGEAQEKLRDKKAAQEAYEKYLELAADAKNSDEIRKKLEKLK